MSDYDGNCCTACRCDEAAFDTALEPCRECEALVCTHCKNGAGLCPACSAVERRKAADDGWAVAETDHD